MTNTSRAIAGAAVAAAVLLSAGGCGTKQAVKTAIEQGVEPTSTGTHDTVPANDAQNAVNGLNNSTRQTGQNAADLGQ